MALLKLYNAGQSKVLVLGSNSGQQLTFPDLTSGDVVSVDYVLLERNESGAGDYWSRVAVGGYSLAVGLYLKDSPYTELAFQDVWSDVGSENKKSGSFSLNTSAITTALTSARSVACTLEIQVTDSTGPWKPFRQELTLYKAFITPNSVVPPATEIAATQAWVKGLMVPKTATSETSIVLQSPDGTQFRFWIDNDGIPQWDRL